MPGSTSLMQDTPTIPLMAPAADAAGRTSRYVNCARAAKVTLYAYINQGNAATVALTVNQAKTQGGGTAKAITVNARIWTILDVVTTDVPVRQSDAVSYTTDAGVKEKLVAMEVDVASLDIANGFQYLAIITGASNAANITSAYAMLQGYRYPSDAHPTEIT